jgi:glycosyltransferase involved in cell wall biosynthesis
LKIGYISFEYPPDSAFGGIATYVHQVAQMMSKRGHQVEVFSASSTRATTEQRDAVTIHWIICNDRDAFRKDILGTFQLRHNQIGFDLIESPEYFGDGYEIKLLFPELPLVVKLHTPQFLIYELTQKYVKVAAKLRYLAGGLRRGRFVRGFWKWKVREDDIDYKITMLADQIHSPSISLGNIVSARWKISRSRILDVPNPFIPNEKYLELPVGSEKCIVTYLGRLEVRKGLVEFSKAIPKIISRIPEVRFRFVGKDLPSHVAGMTMKQYILNELVNHRDKLEFLFVEGEEIPSILKETTVCVFPSIWENFPNVCLEAMSAGRAIIASKKGGMKDMLEKPLCGILIDPLNHSQIANAVVTLLTNKKLNIELGSEARRQVLNKYNDLTLGNLIEDKYDELVNK